MLPQVTAAPRWREPREGGAAAAPAASMLPSEETPDKALDLQERCPRLQGSLHPRIADTETRQGLCVAARKTELQPASHARSFPVEPQGQRSPPPARPFPTSGHKEGAPGGPIPARRKRAGRGAGRAPAAAQARPRLRAPAPRTYQEKQQRAPRAQRHRVAASVSGRQHPSAPPAPRVPARARARSSPAPPPRGSPPPRRPRGPAQRRGSRCGLREKMEPGAGSPEAGRAARAEVGPAWRREAHGGLPPPAAHAPGAVTSPAWGLGVAGPAPPSSPPRPARRRRVARLCSRGPRRPVSRPCSPRPPEGPALCNCARGPGGAEEKDE